MGIEFREGSLSIRAKTDAKIQENTIFNVAVGFQNIPNKQAKDGDNKKVYSLFLADTVVVRAVSKTCWRLSWI